MLPDAPLELQGIVTDPDLPLGVGEVLSIEWDAEAAQSAAQVGDGFASSAVATLDYVVALDIAASSDGTVFLNVADASGALRTASAPIIVGAPDLVITSTSSTRASAFPNAELTISWTGQNSGSARTLSGWTDLVSISADPSGFPRTPIAAPTPVDGPLAAGASYDATAVATLPLQPGSYFLVIESDATGAVEELGGEGANNLRIIPIDVEETPLADLRAEPLLVPSAVAGATVTVEWTVENIGAADADARCDRFWLSEDDVLDPSDIDLGCLAGGEIAAGASETLNADLLIPIATEGPHRIIVDVDALAQVQEENEENNELVSAPFGVEQPDLPDLAVVPFAIDAAGVRRAGSRRLLARTQRRRARGDRPLDRSSLSLHRS